ncbi:MAG: N-6 DNA methylase, partial [Myxococcales bacterium]|nr:N-6 DNA methylase [Myxococcales bacterium]
MAAAGRDDNTEALDAFVAELAARALALRGALRASGVAGRLAQRLAPLERLTRPGQEPRHDADVAAGECAQLLALSLAHARALALRERELSFDGPGALRRVPTTSPLLAAIFESLLGVLEGEGAVAYLDGLCGWLGSARCESVLREHGELLPDRYDRFLSRYDAEAQRARGVYFTPPELVGFMWRSVERALEQELGVALDDPDLSFLDPAVGGGAFLVWLCDRQDAAGLRAAADGRLHGFEVMLPAYAVTHLRLAQRLLRRAPGAALPRVDLCLASALVKPPRAAVEAGGSDALAAAIRAEARAARALHEGAVDVVIGNPPYRRSSDNVHPEIAQRMGPYKRPLAAEPNLQPLSDDYVKFVRRLEVMLEQRERAVLALVTPSTYLSGRLYRAMRGSLLSTFPRADLVDLHGSARGEKPA